MRRAKLPVKASAFEAANRAVPVKGVGFASQQQREQWLDAYVAAGGEVEVVEPGNTLRLGEVVRPCPREQIELRYQHVDGTPVGGAAWVVESPTGEVLYAGKLDLQGYARITQVPYHLSFSYAFHADPAEYRLEQVPEERPDEEATRSMVEEVGRWVWGTLQGDFNKEATTSQIVVNALLGLIPLVDQVLDVRDLVAGVKDLVEYYSEEEPEEKPGLLGLSYETWLWLNVFLIALGCIPEVGSAVKGVLKVLLNWLARLGKQAGALTPKQLGEVWESLVRVLNHYGKGNAHQWLKQLPERLEGWLGQAGQKLKGVLDGVDVLLKRAEERLKNLSPYTKWLVEQGYGPEVLSRAAEHLGKMRQGLGRAYARLEQMKARVNEWVREQLRRVLQGKHHSLERGSTQQPNVRTQQAEEPPPPTTSPYKLTQELAERMAKEEAEKLAAELVEGYGRKAPNCASAVIDMRTGKSYTAGSGSAPFNGKIHPKMQARVDEVPDDLKKQRSPSNCAEFRAMNDALNAGARPEDLVVYTVFTDKVPPKPAHRCRRCQITVTEVRSIPSDK